MYFICRNGGIICVWLYIIYTYEAHIIHTKHYTNGHGQVLRKGPTKNNGTLIFIWNWAISLERRTLFTQGVCYAALCLLKHNVVCMT